MILDIAKVVFSKIFCSRQGQKKRVTVLFVACICLHPNYAFSQYSEKDGGVSIEDYMDNLEPAQNNLEPPNRESASANNPNSNELGDVLPDVLPNNGATNENTHVAIEGFDGATAQFLKVTEPREKTEEELAEEIQRESFEAALTGLFPLRQDQIKALLMEYDATRRSTQKPVHGVPTPQVSVATVSLDPGVAPMTITTAVGHVTTLNVLDITGAPFPLKDVSWAGDFEVIEPEEGGHILRITPLKEEAYGNMSIQLLTLKTPVTIMLKTSKSEVQYRVDARVPEYGPFAQVSLIDGGSERVAGNALITSILDGVPPRGAVSLRVSGVDGRTSAYAVNGLTYVRTPLTLLSPGWEQSVSSADGMNVYALNQTPVLLLSDKGRFMRASLNIEKDSF